MNTSHIIRLYNFQTNPKQFFSLRHYCISSCNLRVLRATVKIITIPKGLVMKHIIK